MTLKLGCNLLTANAACHLTNTTVTSLWQVFIVLYSLGSQVNSKYPRGNPFRRIRCNKRPCPLKNLGPCSLKNQIIYFKEGFLKHSKILETFSIKYAEAEVADIFLRSSNWLRCLKEFLILYINSYKVFFKRTFYHSLPCE